MFKLNLSEKVELFYKTKKYGTAFAVQDEDGNIEILGLDEVLIE